MPIILPEIEVRIIPNMNSITERNCLNYFFWQNSNHLVSDFITSRFEESLIKRTGFNQDNIPEEKKETNIKIKEGLEFKVATSATTKKTSQSDIVDDLFVTISLLRDQYIQGSKPKGLLTIDSQPYIDLNILLNRYKELISFKETKKGLSNSISSIPSIEDIGLEDSIKISISRNYSQLSEANALAYISGKKFVKESNERAKRFKNLIQEESLRIMGIDNSERLNETSVVGYQFDKYSLICQLEPRSMPRYAEILSAFFKEAPKQIKSNSKLGDLEVAKLISQGYKPNLLEKGLIREDFIETYNPLVRDSLVYVKLNGLILKFKEYKEHFTTKSIELNLSINNL